MTKTAYLYELEKHLKRLEPNTIKDILYDYEEHFMIGQEAGKTENEIAASLGSPKMVASQYRYEQAIDHAEKTKRPWHLINAIIVGIGLGFFNLIFVLGIYIGMIGVLIALFASGIALTVAGVSMMIQSVSPIIFSWLSLPFSISGILSRVMIASLGLGFTALGILCSLGLIYLGEKVAKGTVKYLKANITLIQRAGGKYERERY